MALNSQTFLKSGCVREVRQIFSAEDIARKRIQDVVTYPTIQHLSELVCGEGSLDGGGADNRY